MIATICPTQRKTLVIVSRFQTKGFDSERTCGVSTSGKGTTPPSEPMFKESSVMPDAFREVQGTMIWKKKLVASQQSCHAKWGDDAQL